MSTNAESQRKVGRTLLQTLESGNFHTTRGSDQFDRGDPDGLYRDVHTFASVWLKQEEHTDIDQCIARLPFEVFDFDYTIAEWHPESKPVEAIARAHVLRLAKGWKGETALARYLELKPKLAETMGFEDPPGQKALWKAWNKRFSDRHRDALEMCAEEIVTLARYYDVPAPDRVFQVTEDTPEKTEAQLTIDKTRKVWRKAKPFVTDAFHLLRGDNAQIPESAFWEQHAFMGSRDDMFAESGHTSFLAETTRDRAPSPSNHRWQLRKHDLETIREMLRGATKQLVERARRDSELVGDLTVAIDTTKGYEYTGKEQEAHKEWIMGYKDKESEDITYHFQWAVIQIVGLDIPLVLDAIPLKKGESPRVELVDELLRNALDIVDDIELVMMDREFCSDKIKNVCDRHDVYYLNPARKNSSERAKCTALRRSGKKMTVEEQKKWDGSQRKRIYLPSRRSDMWDADEEDDEEEDAEESFRQGLIEDYQDIFDGDEDDEDRQMFEDVVAEEKEREEEQTTRGNKEDTEKYALFETNHPAAIPDEYDIDTGEFTDTGEKDEDRLLQHVEGFIERYRHRWGIENGFKKIKTFMVRTTSKCPRYRFFNFAFACVLNNVWRLVDILVKLEFEDNPDYSPRVDAGTFLTIAKDYLGLNTGPPD